MNDNQDLQTQDTQVQDTQVQDTARVIRETGAAARVASVIEPAIEGLGFRLVRVKVSGQNGCTVQIMAERADGTFSISDCEKVSRDISPILDVEEPIKTQYHLEVSSPGIDRPLVRPIDFERAAGFDAKIELSRPVDTGTGEGRRRYRGLIGPVNDTHVAITLDAEGGEVTVELPFDAMEDARLVMSDALLEAAQKAQEAAAQTLPNDVDIEHTDHEAERDT